MDENTAIYPVILCGGSGTRLWPLSRKSYPKQFSQLLGRESLFQSTVRRMAEAGFAPPLAITGEDFRFIVTEQLAAVEQVARATLIEPQPRNTAPAILAAALWLRESEPDALMLVAPSDHVIPDTPAFRESVEAAIPAARAGTLVTFGVTPTRPETGYGYLALTPEADPQAVSPQPLAGFVEKPHAARAAQMLAEGRFLWNAGIFLFSVKALLAAFERHASDLIEPVGAAVAQAQADLGFTRLAAEPWAQARDISIDYAIMEKADNLAAVPLTAHWSDLGGWEAVWQESGPDGQGNVVSDHALAQDCRDTLLRSESEGLELVGIGLDNIVAVAMKDAVLVARKDRAQEVKDAVATLRAQNVAQATAFARDHRPWGWFESLAVGDRFQVKRIVVKPGGALSLQSHMHRSEHWIVVAGTAEVTIDGVEQLISENQSVYIPLGSVHRLKNPGKLPMALIEVQTGAYLGEDDIIRYEDIYARR